MIQKWSDLPVKKISLRVAVTCFELHSHQGQRHCTVSSAGDLTSMSSNHLVSQLVLNFCPAMRTFYNF